MNKDQAKGVASDITGKVQIKAGKLDRSEEQEIKEPSKQITGKMQKGGGDIEQSAKD